MATTKSSSSKSSSTKAKSSASPNVQSSKGGGSTATVPPLPVKAGVLIETTPTDAVPGNGPLLGHFATVTKGDEKGRYGVIIGAITRKADGSPDDVVFRPRDAAGGEVTVKYDDLEAAEAGGR